MSAGTPLDGQCFVVVEIARGQGTSAIALECIAAGYVTAKQPLRFPALSMSRSLDGHGALRSITGAVPAAGAEVSETVPAGARWELLALNMTFVTSVAAANRITALAFDDGANVYWRTESGTAQAASLTLFRSYSQGLVAHFVGGASNQHGPLPAGNRLGAGHRIRTVTGNFQAADQYSAIQYVVREWIEGA